MQQYFRPETATSALGISTDLAQRSGTPDLGSRSFRRPAEQPERARAVFLHALCRSGSTYIWSRFRELEDARAFYDPLNIDLAKLTPAKLAGHSPDTSPQLRHPTLDAPYFAEYAPLLMGKGVRGYSRPLSVERFFLEPGEAHPALESYFRSLVDEAQLEGRTPVLGLTCGFGRIGWAATRFGGCHIHLDRSPEAIWGSYMDQLGAGNPWFVARWLMIIEANRDHPLVRPLAETMPLRSHAQSLFGNGKNHYRRVAERMTPSDIYRLTFYVWTMAALAGLTHCQAVIDMNLFGEARYRTGAGETVRALTGLAVDFGDARNAGMRTPEMDEVLKRRVEDEVLRSIPLVVRRDAVEAGARRRLGSLAPGKAERLATLI
jgi:hypothetical protein